MDMDIVEFRRKADASLRVFGGVAMNGIDLVGEKNRMDADRRRVAWLREKGYLKGKKSNGKEKE